MVKLLVALLALVAAIVLAGFLPAQRTVRLAQPLVSEYRAVFGNAQTFAFAHTLNGLYANWVHRLPDTGDAPDAPDGVAQAGLTLGKRLAALDNAMEHWTQNLVLYALWVVGMRFALLAPWLGVLIVFAAAAVWDGWCERERRRSVFVFASPLKRHVGSGLAGWGAVASLLVILAPYPSTTMLIISLVGVAIAGTTVWLANLPKAL